MKAADPSYGVSNKPIGDYQLGTNIPSRNYVTGTSRTGMAAGAEENIWLKAGNGTGVSGTPGRKVPGSLGSTGMDVGKPKVPDVPGIGGKGRTAKAVPVSKPTYTQKIKWGIHEVDVRPEGNGFWGQRVRQSDSRVDAYELKINPQNESFYLQHPDGGMFNSKT